MVWCVVCDTLKKPCVPAPRVHVFSACARGAGTHGDVLNVRTGTCGGRGRRQPRFSSVNKCFFDILQHLNRMLGSSLIANFLLTKICPHMGYHVLQRFTEESLGSYIH